MANDLVISVGASIRDLERQMAAAAKVAEQRADEIEGQFRKRNISLGGDFGLGVLKGAIAGFSLERVVKGFLDANKEIAAFGDTAKRVGLELERFQALRIAAQGEGIDGKEFDKGVDALAKALNEARREENELTKFLDANNVKYKDRKGEIISTNEALAVAADLISRAATEQDKIEIAKRFSLPADFVPLLENGSAALSDLAKKAAEAGGILDADVVQKAKEFDSAWAQGWASFEANAKSSIVRVGQWLGSLSNIAQDIGNSDFANRLNNAMRQAFPDSYKEYDRQQLSRFRQSEIASQNEGRPLELTVKKAATKFPSKSSGGGSGSSAKSEEEQAQTRLDRYIESLVRQRAVMEAEIATVGKSNAERKAAVEIAKAQVDLDKLSATEKANYIAKLTQEVSANEAVRASKERLEQAQKDLNEAQKYFGNAAVDALEDLIINGAKAEDVMKRLIASLAKAALQAALLGEGPLAGIFGTKGANGATGGLLGLLFKGFASGGYVSGPGSGRSDSIPARLSNGEYVVNARATKQNRALLDAINSGKLPAFADGGLVGRVPTIPAASRSSGGMQVVVNNTVSDQVQATPQRGNDGSIQIMIEAIKGDIASDLIRGQGSVGFAMKAVGSGRQLRG